MATDDQFEDEEFDDDVDDEDEDLDIDELEDLSELGDDFDDDDEDVDEDEDEDTEETDDDEDEDEDDVAVDEDEEDEEAEESLDVLLAREKVISDDELALNEPPREGLSRAPVSIGAGEFTCRSCFLVKRRAQLADEEALLCFDCA